MKNVFFLREESRWNHILKHAKQDDIAVKIDTALHTVEKNNKVLAGALPDNYFSRPGAGWQQAVGAYRHHQQY